MTGERTLEHRRQNPLVGAAIREGTRTALGLPSLVLVGAYIGFGSLCRESGLSVWLGLTSTLTHWALPGQIAMIELAGTGASLFVIALAVALTNARLLPMTVTLMPLLRREGTPRWRYYLGANFVAATAWAVSMRRCPQLQPEQRLAYFVSFGATLWLVTIAGTAIGFFLAGLLPRAVTLGLIFINPLYFMLLFAMDMKQRARALALVFGAVLGPALQPLAQDWGLLLTGLVGGTAAFLVNRRLPRAPGAGRAAPASTEPGAEAEAS